MEYIPCDLCGSDVHSPFLTRKDRFSSEIFFFVRCEKCGSIFLNPRPTQSQIEQYYPDDYESYKGLSDRDSGNQNWQLSRSLSWQIEYVEKFIPKSSYLLDVGCGTGDFLRKARNRGWRVKGIEPVEKAADIARLQFGLDVFTGSLDSRSFVGEEFDVITMWDVLEHLPSPTRSLRIIHDILKPDGFVVFSIPNLLSFDRYLFKTKWIGWDAPRHLNLLDEKGIIKLVEKTRYEIMDRKCITGAKGTFFLNLDELFGRKRNKKLDPLISTIFWPYRKLAYLTNRSPIITYAIRSLR